MAKQGNTNMKIHTEPLIVAISQQHEREVPCRKEHTHEETVNRAAALDCRYQHDFI